MADPSSKFHWNNSGGGSKEDWAADVAELVAKFDPSEELCDLQRMSKRDLQTLVRVLTTAIARGGAGVQRPKGIGSS